MKKKELLAKVLNLVGLIPLFRFFSKKNRIVVLAYHRVKEIPKNYNFDTNLISATCVEFGWQINYLKKHYNPITFSALLTYLESNRKVPKNTVIITFDDGFDDNYYNAYRMLSSINVPATFFISSDYMDCTQTFWFDRVVYMFNLLDVGFYSFDNGALKIRIESAHADRSSHSQSVLSYLKTIPNNERIKFIAELEELSRCPYPLKGFSESKPMSWDNVEEMVENGMEIGSHTKSHPILSKLSRNELVEELRGSKLEIESRIKTGVQVIAYPVGGYSAINSDVIREVKNEGYMLACTYVSGVNLVDSMDPFLLKRLHVEYYTTRNMFKSMLVLPELFS